MKNSIHFNFTSKPACFVLLACLALMNHAQAKAPPQTTHVKQIKFLPGSQETARERSSRLKRECKGGVNAGACAGYTR